MDHVHRADASKDRIEVDALGILMRKNVHDFVFCTLPANHPLLRVGCCEYRCTHETTRRRPSNTMYDPL